MPLSRCTAHAVTGFWAAALLAGCGNPRSLLRVYVSGDRQFGDVTLSLQASRSADQTVIAAEYPSVTVPLFGAEPLKVGLYLPASMKGTVLVRGAVMVGSCEIGVGEATVADVESGASVVVNLTLKAEECVPIADAGAGGAGNDAAADAGGGAGGTGGINDGTGGIGSGGAGTGGMGTGGMGTGGSESDAAPTDAPADMTGPPDVPCEPETVASTCGRRCNIDAVNNCGQTIHCGGCVVAGEMCGDARTPNVCVPCQDTTRVCRNLECGVVVDACGQRVNCGVCAGRDVCCNGRCQLPFRCQAP